MIYDRSDIERALTNLRLKFSSWDPVRLSLIHYKENHLVDGKNFLSWIKTNDPVENFILDLLEDYAKKAENVGVGSGISLLKNVLDSHSVCLEDVEKVLQTSRYPIEGDFERIIFSDFDEQYHSLLLEVLNRSEPDGNVMIKRENIKKTILEKMDGYVFNLSSPARIHSFEERSVKCFIIDGFIESVGEIHHVLEFLSKNVSPGIIFARNYSPDVITTIQHNRSINRLNVLPIHVPFDLEDLNTLVDIAVISSGDIVSSDKGNLIRTIASDSAPELERVSYSSGKLVISNSKTVSKVKLHLSNLQKRAHENIDETKRKMIESRMANLTSNCLKIAVPIGKEQDALEIVLDKFLRIVRSSLLYGLVEIDGRILPVPSFISSNLFTKKFQNSLGSAGRIIAG